MVEISIFWHILCAIFKNSTWGALGPRTLLSNSSNHPLVETVLMEDSMYTQISCNAIFKKGKKSKNISPNYAALARLLRLSICSFGKDCNGRMLEEIYHSISKFCLEESNKKESDPYLKI